MVREPPLLELDIVTSAITLWGVFPEAEVRSVRFSQGAPRRVIGFRVPLGLTGSRLATPRRGLAPVVRFCARRLVHASWTVFWAPGTLVAGQRHIRTRAVIDIEGGREGFVDVGVAMHLGDLGDATWLELCRRWVTRQSAGHAPGRIVRVFEHD